MSTSVTSNSHRQPTQTELEMEAGRKALERRATQFAVPVAPQKTNGGATIIPFSLDKMQFPKKPTQAFAALPKESLAEGIKQPEPNAGQAKQSGTNPLKFNHATALEFYNAVRPSAFIFGFKLGRSITSAEEFQTLTKEADDKYEHLFFHVATLKPEWSDPKTHKSGSITTAAKDHILECPYLWGDCDPEKYAGNNPAEATKHYSDEGFARQAKQSTTASIVSASHHSPSGVRGAGWQFPIKLDQAIEPNEAETLVGKLHTALGFDPVVRNYNRILRVPGSVNWKDGKDGRVPSSCTSLILNDKAAATKTDDVRKALAHVAEPLKEANASGATEITIDWSKVKSTDGWLKSVDDLPVDAPTKLRIIVGHSGNLKELNDQLTEAKLLDKAYPSWSEVTQAAAAGFKQCGTLSPEQIAEAFLADLPFNHHIAKQKDKERAIERAINQAHNTKRAVIAGVAFRDFTDKGKPRASLANAVIAIKALGIEVRQDLFHNRTIVNHKGAAPTIREGDFTDDTIGAIRSLVNNTYQLDCGDEHTLAAVKEIARDHSFDPVLDYLAECEGKWDGKTRIETWVIDYMGVEDTPLHRAIGRLMLIASVRRARVPGCKFDQICVLESEEGYNKSTAIKVLAGEENFSDQSVLNVSEREAQEQLEGVWLHELADLTGLKKAEIERVKAFASRQRDRARPAYGRVREDRPRRCTQWATTNDNVYLASQTGNRRFWSLPVGRINIDALRRDRDQLWGEAATFEATGVSIVLDPKLWPAEHEEQEKRRIVDPWEAVIEDMPVSVMVGEPPHQRVIQIIHDDISQKKEMISSADVLVYICKVPTGQQHPEHGKRLARIVKRFGWETPKSGRVSILGKQCRGYWRGMPFPVDETQLPKRPAPPEGIESLADGIRQIGQSRGQHSKPTNPLIDSKDGKTDQIDVFNTSRKSMGGNTRGGDNMRRCARHDPSAACFPPCCYTHLSRCLGVYRKSKNLFFNGYLIDSFIPFGANQPSIRHVVGFRVGAADQALQIAAGRRWQGLDNPPRRCSPTSGATVTPFPMRAAKPKNAKKRHNKPTIMSL